MKPANPLPSGVVTFLLTDVEGSTKLWESHSQKMGEAMAWHDKMVGTAAISHHGFVLKARGEGDSQFMVFADPADALATAVTLQRALTEEIPALPFPLRVRAGLHTGSAEWREGDYYGSVVNRCARIRSLAFGGQTLLSEATANLVRDTLAKGLTLIDKGTHPLKGLSRPEKVFQLSIQGLLNDFPPIQSANIARNNLPAPSTPLIGREQEVGELVGLLTYDGPRLVTVTGPGGTGKTRLALAVGAALQDSFQDGVWFVDLAALAHPEEIAPAIAAAMNYQAPDKSGEFQPQLIASLGQRSLLLILDNFEHLLGGVALVSETLKACPTVKILVTSRQRLNLASENRIELRGLDYPEWLSAQDASNYRAVQLFVDSGQRVQPGFRLTSENLSAVVHICQLVQGMPLGLLLAATWLQLLSPAEIAVEIERSLEFLAADLADLPLRQRSMHAVFDGSWQLLPPKEQNVLARLSVFRGGFTREAAEQVAGANLQILLALANKSLLQRSIDSDRFMMQELLRQYAAKQRQFLDSDDESSLSHCRYFAGLVTAEMRRALFFFPLGLPRRYSADRDNLRRAWDYALEQRLATELVDLTIGVIFFAMRQGNQVSIAPAQAIGALLLSGVPESATPILRLQLTQIVGLLGSEDVHVLIDQGLKLAAVIEEDGDQRLRYWTYDQLATAYGDLRDPLAFHWLSKAKEVALEMGDEIFAKVSEARVLWLSVEQERYDPDVTARLGELLASFETQFPESHVTYTILCALADVNRYSGDLELALDFGLRALAIAKQWEDLFWISYVNQSLSRTYLQMGKLHEARLAALDSLEWHLTVGQPWQILGFLWSLAAQIPELVGGHEAAAAIISLVYNHPEVTEKHKQFIVEIGRPAIIERLGTEAFEEAWERGKGFDLDTLIIQLRAMLTSEVAADN